MGRQVARNQIETGRQLKALIDAFPWRCRGHTCHRQHQIIAMLLETEPGIGGEAVGVGGQRLYKGLHLGADSFITLYEATAPDSRNLGRHIYTCTGQLMIRPNATAALAK
jgi:hypothetical protein